MPWYTHFKQSYYLKWNNIKKIYYLLSLLLLATTYAQCGDKARAPYDDFREKGYTVTVTPNGAYAVKGNEMMVIPSKEMLNKHVLRAILQKLAGFDHRDYLIHSSDIEKVVKQEYPSKSNRSFRIGLDPFAFAQECATKTIKKD